MKISYNELQKNYFDGALPTPDVVADALTFHAWEIESVEKVGEAKPSKDGRPTPLNEASRDTVLDVKVLPDKSAWALSTRGIAKDLSVILNIPLVHDPLGEVAVLEPKTNNISVTVETATCTRYTAAFIRGVAVGPSPEWLSTSLKALGQRSINNIVDITNYVMFGLGQPLHAFDAEKLVKDGTYRIVVRNAKSGERITTLTGEEYALTENDALIVDGGTDMPIGIAGIKGGKHAGVDVHTVDIILESANFEPVLTRKTSQRLKLRTDASQRFENNISRDMAGYGLRDAVKFVLDIAGGTLEGYVDTNPEPVVRPPVSVTLAKINSVLGLTLSLADVENILKRFGYTYAVSEEVVTVTPPFERPDLNIPEDVIEEIGRMYGYEHVPASIPEKVVLSEINKKFFYGEALRDTLTNIGFSEVFTSSFRDSDEVKLKNAFASDKGYLRSEKGIVENMKDALAKNAPNADLFGTDQIRIFELGKVFDAVGEHDVLVLGVQSKQGYVAKKDKKILDDALVVLQNVIGDFVHKEAEKTAIIDVSKILEILPQPTAYAHHEKSPDVMYQSFSLYPYITRDIAFWTPLTTSAEDAEKVIRESAGALTQRVDLFDRFEKAPNPDEPNGQRRVSYGFRIVFQSYEKTLDGAEADALMQTVSSAVGAKGWVVR